MIEPAADELEELPLELVGDGVKPIGPVSVAEEVAATDAEDILNIVCQRLSITE